ncbi:hypothetical protein BBJ28_00004719 [Nothophytophthora sp. Chile5]|nr:hypothetical protein BBJ28_00004719 [Nothophytophthora sp. Chile5]
MEAPLVAPQRRVKLVVRNVYAPSQALALSVDPEMLVGELKDRLHGEFPNRPMPPHQKLIFGGKICEDNDTLNKVLAQVQTSHQQDGDDGDEAVVFHLLVTSTAPKATSAAPTRSEVHVPQQATASGATLPLEINTQGQQNAVEAADSPRPSVSAAPTAPSAFNVAGATASTPGFVAPSSFPFHQPAVPSQQQQDLYRQSVMMQQQAMLLTQIQYLQYLQMHQRQQHAHVGAMPAVPQHQQHLFGAHFAAPYGNYYGMIPAQVFQAQGLGHAAVNGAPYGAVPTPTPMPAAPEIPATPARRPMIVQMAREVFPLLDLRLALKMAFMLFIIGQDTPTDRILMLALLSFISYLHITGIFAKLYEVYKQGHNAEGNGEAPPNAAAGPNAPPGAAAAAGAAISERYGMLTRVLRISPDRGVVQDVKYFVVGLLLSLVPAWHPQPMQGAAAMPHEDAMADGAGDVPLQGI